MRNILPNFDLEHLNLSRTLDPQCWWSQADSPTFSTKTRPIPLQNLNMSAFTIDWNMEDPDDDYDDPKDDTTPMSPFSTGNQQAKLSMNETFLTIGGRSPNLSGYSRRGTSDDPFIRPFWNMEVKTFMAQAWKWLHSGLALTLNNSVNSIIMIINFYYMGLLESPLLQASFGLGVSYWAYLSLTFTMCAFETTGIRCAKAFGQKNFEALSACLYQGIIFQTILTILSCFLFWFSEEILVSVGIAEDSSIEVAYMVKWLIPSVILQGINFQFVAFCMSQGISTPFGVSNFLSIGACVAMCPFLFNYMQVGI